MCGIGLTLLPTECSHCREARGAAAAAQPSAGTTDAGEESERQAAEMLHESMARVLARRGPDLPRGRHDVPAAFSLSSADVDEEDRGQDGGKWGGTAAARRAFRVDDRTGRVDGGCDCTWRLSLLASVLHMRGETVAEQPHLVEDDGGAVSALCWNGECYSYDLSSGRSGEGGGIGEDPCEAGLDLPLCYDAAHEEGNARSDTIDVANILRSAMQKELRSDKPGGQNSSESREHEAVATALSCIHGEYSFILFRGATRSGGNGCVYFGRDPLGRRSLLMAKCQPSHMPPSFFVSSAAFDVIGDNKNEGCKPSPFNFTEIEAGKVFRIDLSTGNVTFVALPRPVPSPAPSVKHDADYAITLSKEKGIPEPMVRASEILLAHLDRAVRRRVVNAPMPKDSSSRTHCDSASVGILFSGGLDSVVLAALSHSHIAPAEPIDLINVAFTSSSVPVSSSPDRLAALLSWNEMRIRWPNRHWRFIEVDVPYEAVLRNEKRVCQLISPLGSTMDFNIATAFWFASRGHGTEAGRESAQSSAQSNLLRYAPRREGKIVSKTTKEKECVTDGCKRRSTPGCAFGACKSCCYAYQKPINHFLGGSARMCPGHNKDCFLKRVKSNASANMNTSPRDPSEYSNVDCKPGRSMQGNISESSENVSANTAKEQACAYKAEARVLLCGIGADEQLAGYGRHRSVFNRSGYDGLRAELKMERERLWTRNLGRDDRCMSDHGKEARFPFLDEDVVAFINSLDVLDICDMTRPQGEGDKMILRLIAKKIGVEQCSGLVKRAIQFGSRIAKCSDVDRYGSSRKATGTAPHNSRRDEKVNKC